MQNIPQSTIGKGRINSVELLRAIASLMVCFYHFTNGNPRYLPEGNILRNVGHYGAWGVEIFFIVSGFVIPLSMFKNDYSFSDFWIFLKKRIIRIEPPYLLSILIVLMLGYLSSLNPNYRGLPFSIDWLNVLLHIGYINVFFDKAWISPVYWTLAIEFQYYLLIALIYPVIITSGNLLKRVLFYTIFLLISFVMKDATSVLAYGCFFLCGITFFLYRDRLIHSVEYFIVNLVCLFYIIVEFEVLMALLVSLTILILFLVKEVPKWVHFFANISYSLYLLHVPFGGRVINLMEVKATGMPMKYAGIVLALLVSILASWIFYKYVERPLVKLSHSIKYNSKLSVQRLASSSKI